MVEDWISLREFARRRGVALSAVQKAIETGRVTAVKKTASGRLHGIEAHAATLQWNANTDPAEAAKNGKSLGDEITPVSVSLSGGAVVDVPASGSTAPGSAAAMNEDETRDPVAAGATALLGKDPHGYQAARAERERINVQQQEIELAKSLGLLLSKDEQRQVSARRYRTIRDQILNIPDRIAAQLAAERDAGQVHAMLTAELKRVLHELSDDARAEAARGIAERVAA